MKYILSYKIFESKTEFLEPPDNLEDQIAFSMKWYPGLYDSKYGRIKVLAHMYLSYGTEYEWVDGKLLNLNDGLNTDHDMYEYRRRVWEAQKEEGNKRLDRLLDHWENMSSIVSRTGQGHEYLKDIQRDINELQDEMDNFNPYGKEYPNERPYEFRANKLSDEFSPIFHIPENVESDYLEGAKELIRYLISNGCEDERIIKLGNQLGI